MTAILLNSIYSIFGHGVSSAAMTWMFLYPLLGGSLFYFLLEGFLPGIKQIKGYRIFYNSYNSGIALFTLGSLLHGIVDIAGTNSPFVTIYYITGGIGVITGLIILRIFFAIYRKASRHL